jgi:hypothetical protein
MILAVEYINGMFVTRVPEPDPNERVSMLKLDFDAMNTRYYNMVDQLKDLNAWKVEHLRRIDALKQTLVELSR